MSYLIVSGESPRECRFEVVETEAQIADAVARAVYGTTQDALAEPVAFRDMVAEFIRNEELRFEDGFVRLFVGGMLGPKSKPEICRVPDGWKLVPLEPTKKMIDAAYSVPRKAYRSDFTHPPEGVWAAMLAAAPESPNIAHGVGRVFATDKGKPGGDYAADVYGWRDESGRFVIERIDLHEAPSQCHHGESGAPTTTGKRK